MRMRGVKVEQQKALSDFIVGIIMVFIFAHSNGKNSSFSTRRAKHYMAIISSIFFRIMFYFDSNSAS